MERLQASSNASDAEANGCEYSLPLLSRRRAINRDAMFPVSEEIMGADFIRPQQILVTDMVASQAVISNTTVPTRRYSRTEIIHIAR